LYPVTPLDVLVFHPKATLCCGAVPEPVSDSTEGELEALLVRVMLAVEVPATVGVNATWNGTVLPAGMVTGNAIPLTENWDPLTPREDTITGPLVALRVPV
jgi:hypothetical protein